MLLTFVYLSTPHLVIAIVRDAVDLLQNANQFGRCASLKEDTYDEHFGIIKLMPELYCQEKNGRSLKGVQCCAPRTSTQINPNLLVYLPDEDKDNDNQALFYDNSPFWREKFKSYDQDVVIVIHGWLETGFNNTWMNRVKDGYIAQGHPVVLVDWGGGSKYQYFQAMANVRMMGLCVGLAIINWNVADKLLLVGFSLGGQMINEIANYVKVQTGKTIKECHGLDPAGPGFDLGDKDLRIDQSDCDLVQVIHTSAFYDGSNDKSQFVETILFQLGTKMKSGHCDYWINCGHSQQSCSQDGRNSNTTMLSDALLGTLACSHFRAAYHYAASVNGKCDFEAKKCKNCGTGKQCSATSGKGKNTLPPFSNCDPRDKHKSYVVFTKGTNDFC